MKRGISLISLIITIVVIIILASIFIFSGFNSPDSANFAKYSTQVDSFQSAIYDDYLKKNIRYSSPDNQRTKAHTYYSIATGIEVDINTNLDELEETIQLSDMNLEILPDKLDGKECYLVTKGALISGKKDEKGLYTDFDTIEKHYITDNGEFFILPGYPYENDGKTRWYINSSKYYEGQDAIQAVMPDSNTKRIFFDVNSNNGKTSETTRVREIGQIIGDLPTATRPGYMFDGWYTLQDGGTKVSPSDTMGEEKVTFYAHWTSVEAEVNGIPYLTFADAINGVPKNGTETVVKMYSDVQGNFIIDKKQNIVFDLQGHTLSNNSDAAVITNKGTISMTNGIITTNATKFAAVDNNSGAIFKISNGRIVVTGNRQAIYNDKGTVEISGTAYLSSESEERATVQNLASGTMTITGGTIISKKMPAISNAGTLIIGKKDGQMSVNSPMIQGATFGVSSTSKFCYYDGTIKGQTKAIEDESKIKEIEENAFLKHDQEKKDDLNYLTAFLSFDAKEYTTVYEHPDDYVFDGTNYLKIDVNLFSNENIHKDFSISFTIKNYTITNQSQPTIVNIKDESGNPYNGIAYRLAEKTTGLQFSPKGCPNPTIHNPLGDITENLKVLIERRDNIIYLSQNDILCYECNYSSFSSYFNVPITIGSSYKNGAPFRYFKGTLSNIIVKVEK